MTLEIERENRGQLTLLKVRGEIDLYTSPKLRTAILEAIETAGTGAGIDLSGVDYMDSSGVATLVEGLRSARDNDARFELVAPSEAVMKVLRLARLDGLFEVSSEP